MRWPGLALVAVLAVGATAVAQPAPAPVGPSVSPAGSGSVDNPLQIPDLSRVLPTATTPEGVSATLKILVIMTVLTLAPAILMMTTSFTRILIVLAMLRQALGVQQLPPSQILVGISLFLTFLIMAPTYERIHREAVKPWLDNAPGMTQSRAIEIAEGHLREFMFNQIERTKNEEDIYLFLEYSRKAAIPLGTQVTRADVPTSALVPAFILSELKTSFVLGFRIYLPFLVIDMVIATVLISMGMLMLPPVMISLPFKLLLFVLADGWYLVVGALLAGFA
ncbi:MAG TPA: flagellar type III secretion system pore protein FliP [Phycisphaerae bacterium]|nr:flagellar type III secretion system pore protein FliP [Phycisphaerae bacterium]HOJ74305.1 flagellar type III secretion system pore protein FliP [Phycisphaerae bacterium]HOM51384.1 flagellar type III secretion system pore protein FliP [Phycisphaerae bacterium]HON67128.1 flagellar type III secretion system pore protein FliP [Phycisphaerae bacterium]HOQ84985.1 flagellar type III secretion system pore protein FliP [Phycisphaerae bacterium]